MQNKLYEYEDKEVRKRVSDSDIAERDRILSEHKSDVRELERRTNDQINSQKVKFYLLCSCISQNLSQLELVSDSLPHPAQINLLLMSFLVIIPYRRMKIYMEFNLATGPRMVSKHNIIDCNPCFQGLKFWQLYMEIRQSGRCSHNLTHEIGKTHTWQC